MAAAPTKHCHGHRLPYGHQYHHAAHNCWNGKRYEHSHTESQGQRGTLGQLQWRRADAEDQRTGKCYQP